MADALAGLRDSPTFSEWLAALSGVERPSLSAEAGDHLERALSDAAWWTPPLAPARALGDPTPLRVRVMNGALHLLERAPDGDGFLDYETVSLSSLREALSPPDHTSLEAAAHQAAHHLGLSDELDLHRLTVASVHEVVERPSSDRHWSLDEARAEAPDAELGDEFLRVLPTETNAVRVVLICALSEQRPLRVVAPPDPGPLVEASLQRTAARAGWSLNTLLKRLNEVLIQRPWAYSGPRHLTLGADGVRHTLVTRAEPCEGVDRGPVPIDVVRARATSALVALADAVEYETQPEDDVASPLRTLLPMREATLVALVRRLRQAFPIHVRASSGDERGYDETQLARDFDTMASEALERRVLAAGQQLNTSYEGWTDALARMAEVLRMERPPTDVEPDITALLTNGEDDAATLLAGLADRACSRAGLPRMSRSWSQDSIDERAFVPIVGRLVGNDLDALLE